MPETIYMTIHNFLPKSLTQCLPEEDFALPCLPVLPQQ